MNRKILIAGATAALVVGGVAIAQTTAPQTEPVNPGTTPPAASDSTMPDRSTNSMPDRSTTTSPSAGAYGADTAAQADTSGDSSMMAGERG